VNKGMSKRTSGFADAMKGVFSFMCVSAVPGGHYEWAVLFSSLHQTLILAVI
jgi:hypothetical protein